MYQKGMFTEGIFFPKVGMFFPVLLIPYKYKNIYLCMCIYMCIYIFGGFFFETTTCYIDGLAFREILSVLFGKPHSYDEKNVSWLINYNSGPSSSCQPRKTRDVSTHYTESEERDQGRQKDNKILWFY